MIADNRILNNGLFRIEIIGINNNTVIYEINGIPWELCLVGRKEMRNINNVMSNLLRIDNALKTYNSSDLNKAIDRFGGSSSLSLLYTLFKDDTIVFFSWYAQKITVEDNDILYPSKIAKDFFGKGASRYKYYPELLSLLESKVQDNHDYLVGLNDKVLHSDARLWKLYRKVETALYTCTLDYTNISLHLMHEAQDYMRNCAKKMIKQEADYERYIENKWKYISRGIDILQDSQGKELNSVLELTTLDIQYLQAYLAQSSPYATGSQRRLLLFLHGFFIFVRNNTENDTLPDPFRHIKLPNTTDKNIAPVSTHVMDVLRLSASELPQVVNLIHMMASITGARANSIFLLTTDDIYYNETTDTYSVRITNNKTKRMRSEKGLPISQQYHDLPHKYAHELFEFIDKTKHLRAQLKKPYIFVYEPSHRNGSTRLPQVMSVNAYWKQINKVLRSTNEYEEDLPLNCNMRRIRAEVGRAMFHQGKTATEVAHKLGNSPVISGRHYNKQYPSDEAQQYNQLYQHTIVSNLSNNEISLNNNESNGTMYGTCKSKKKCPHPNNCLDCSKLITKKE